MPKRSCEVHFLDVGQGSASVVLYYNPATELHEAIVIDCGSTDGVLLSVLDTFVDYIRALIITHNHDDHAGAAPVIIETWCRPTEKHPGGRIGAILVVCDEPKPRRKLGQALKT